MDSVEIFTHDELVKRASKWLVGSQNCKIAFQELVTNTVYGEIPDAIGFKSDGQTILVECKTSKSDFRQDRKKTFRLIHNRGMGKYRYIMCAPGVINPDEMRTSGYHDWGLLWTMPKIIKVIKRSDIHERFADAELSLVTSCLTRVAMLTPMHFPNGVFTNITYDHIQAMRELEDQRMDETKEINR